MTAVSNILYHIAVNLFRKLFYEYINVQRLFISSFLEHVKEQSCFKQTYNTSYLHSLLMILTEALTLKAV